MNNTTFNINDKYICDQIASVEIIVRTKGMSKNDKSVKIKVTGKDIAKSLSLHQVASHYLGSVAKNTCTTAISKDLERNKHRSSPFLKDIIDGKLDDFYSNSDRRLFIEHDPVGTVKQIAKGVKHPMCVHFRVNFYDSNLGRVFRKKYAYNNSADANSDIAIGDILWKIRSKKLKSKKR